MGPLAGVWAGAAAADTADAVAFSDATAAARAQLLEAAIGFASAASTELRVADRNAHETASLPSAPASQHPHPPTLASLPSADHRLSAADAQYLDQLRSQSAAVYGRVPPRPLRPTQPRVTASQESAASGTAISDDVIVCDFRQRQ
jgi:hypothetical protein